MDFRRSKALTAPTPPFLAVGLPALTRLIVSTCLIPAYIAAQTPDYAAHNINAPLLSSSNTVVRRHEQKITILNTEEAEITLLYAVTILNKGGDDAKAWYEAEGKFQKIKSFEARLFNASGALLRTSKKSDIETFGDFSSYGFSDTQFKGLELFDINYPYTVEFSVKKTLKGFFQLPSFTIQKTGQAIEKAYLSITAPADYSLKWKGVNTAIQPVQKTVDKLVYTDWVFENIPAVPEELYTNFAKGDYAQIILAPVKVSIDGFSGNFENWTQMGRFFYDMNKDRDELSPGMKAQVLKMTEGISNNRAKIDTLYRFVQRNCRYVSIQLGIGGWQTFDAGFVEQKQYGDCKALCNYTKALLKAAGIPSYMALVYGDDDGGLPLWDEAPAPAFNHVILYVPGEDMWLECTSQHAPCGYLGSFTANRQVLLLTPDGGKKVSTPSPGVTENTKSTASRIAILEDGKALVQSRFVATGAQQELYRSLQKDLQKDEMEKRFIEYQEIPVSQLNFLKIQASTTAPEATVFFEGILTGFFTKSGKRLFVPVNKIHPFRRSLVTDDQRVHDISFPAVYTFTDTIILYLPAGYQTENLPTPKKIQNEFGQYEITIEPAADQIVFVRKVAMPALQIPASRYEEMRKAYIEMIKADGIQVVLVKTE